MSRYLPFIDKVLLESNSDKDALFIEVADMYQRKLKSMEFKFKSNIDYNRLYKDLYEGEESLLERLDPSKRPASIFNVAGEEASLSFWLYLTCRLIEEKVKDPDIWSQFGLAMKDSVYVSGISFPPFLKKASELDFFPIDKIVSSSDIICDIRQEQLFIVELLECKGFISAIINNNMIFSFRRTINRLTYLSTLTYDLWIRAHRALEKFKELGGDKIIQDPQIAGPLQRALLLKGDSFTDTLREMISIFLEEIEDHADFKFIEFKTLVVPQLISCGNQNISNILNADFNPENIEQPQDILSMRFLLLSNFSKSPKTSNSYHRYNSYYSIYDGNKHSYKIRESLTEELLPFALEGLDSLVKKHDLKMFV